eukprot:SAG11_NODE_15703_length_567_cov_30.628998_1_plen_111_part_00
MSEQLGKMKVSTPQQAPSVPAKKKTPVGFSFSLSDEEEDMIPGSDEETPVEDTPLSSNSEEDDKTDEESGSASEESASDSNSDSDSDSPPPVRTGVKKMIKRKKKKVSEP